MVSFLLIISFLLHIVTIYAVFFLYKQIQTLKNSEVSEITNLFEEYIQQIKEENVRLQKDIQKDLRVPRTEKESSISKTVETVTSQPSSTNDPILNTDGVEDSMEASLEAKVLQLYHKGQTVTEIAKNLNCGKTEADLIIKFHKKVSE